MVVGLSLHHQWMSPSYQSITVLPRVVLRLSVCHCISNGCLLVFCLPPHHQWLPPGCRSISVSPMFATWLSVYYCITYGCHLASSLSLYHQWLSPCYLPSPILPMHWFSHGCWSVPISPMVVIWLSVYHLITNGCQLETAGIL